MNNKYYLRIEGKEFYPVCEGYYKILDTDIAMTEEEHNRYCQGQFRLKENPTGENIFDYIEEYEPEVIVDNTPTDGERLRALEMALLEVL